jgi:hypothetical protein
LPRFKSGGHSYKQLPYETITVRARFRMRR